MRVSRTHDLIYDAFSFINKACFSTSYTFPIKTVHSGAPANGLNLYHRQGPTSVSKVIGNVRPRNRRDVSLELS